MSIEEQISHSGDPYEPSGLAGAIFDEGSSRKANSTTSTEDLPQPADIPTALGLGLKKGEDGRAASPAPPTLLDGRSRSFRLAVAIAGSVGLAGLWLAAAFLRDEALHRVPPSVGGALGLVGSSIHPHTRPSYTALFLLLSYSVVLAGIAFSTGVHDPHGVRLRVARKRVEKATREYDRAFAQRVLGSLEVEQTHLDMVHLAPKRVEIVKERDRRRPTKDDSGMTD
jgi:hypothetical protein